MKTSELNLAKLFSKVKSVLQKSLPNLPTSRDFPSFCTFHGLGGIIDCKADDDVDPAIESKSIDSN